MSDVDLKVEWAKALRGVELARTDLRQAAQRYGAVANLRKPPRAQVEDLATVLEKRADALVAAKVAFADAERDLAFVNASAEEMQP